MRNHFSIENKKFSLFFSLRKIICTRQYFDYAYACTITFLPDFRSFPLIRFLAPSNIQIDRNNETVWLKDVKRPETLTINMRNSAQRYHKLLLISIEFLSMLTFRVVLLYGPVFFVFFIRFLPYSWFDHFHSQINKIMQECWHLHSEKKWIINRKKSYHCIAEYLGIFLLSFFFLFLFLSVPVALTQLKKIHAMPLQLNNRKRQGH